MRKIINKKEKNNHTKGLKSKYKKAAAEAFWRVQPQVCVQVRQAARHSA